MRPGFMAERSICVVALCAGVFEHIKTPPIANATLNALDLALLPELREKNRSAAEKPRPIANKLRRIKRLGNRLRVPSGKPLREADWPLREGAGTKRLRMIHRHF